MFDLERPGSRSGVWTTSRPTRALIVALRASKRILRASYAMVETTISVRYEFKKVILVHSYKIINHLRGNSRFQGSPRGRRAGAPVAPYRCRLQLSAVSSHQPSACDLRLTPCDYLFDAVSLLPSVRLPMASPESTSSTRRFCWRPSGVSFDATGAVFPKPLAVTASAGIPCCTR